MRYYPKISIVTPVYNRHEYLEETILSVINQNYPNLEYIIIDGGSNDGTVDIIKKFESKLAYWISEPDGGMYFALQKGFVKATGEILAWINSDDKYIDKSLFAVAQIFSDLSEIEWIMGMPTLLNEEGICVKISQGRRWSESRFYAGDFRWIQQDSVFWKRSLWDRTGRVLDTSYKYAGDFELWCRFFQSTQLFTVSSSFSGFRSHGDQISIQYLKEYESETTEIIQKIKPPPGNALRYKIIKQIWELRNCFDIQGFLFTKYFPIILTWFVDKMHKCPPQIYYDVTEKKWKK